MVYRFEKADESRSFFSLHLKVKIKIMDQYFQEGGVDIPTFDFNPNSGILGISGRSFPENTVGVYLPLLEWLDTYVQNAAPETCIKFNLDYFNSSTYKAFLNILLRLEKLIDQDKKVKS